MAQLTDDCFAFGGDLLPVDELERIIRERVTPVAETEAVPLGQARRRVLAADVVAPVSLPPFDNSAVDGFAVRHADLNTTGDTRLKVVERLTAGVSPTQSLASVEAVRIFTGAPMPEGADTVFMQEDCRIDGDHVVLPSGLKR
jgi:molybdopterin molybdotransferase